MYFREGAPLRNEYDFLFRSLFKDSGFYMRIVDVISKKNKGITRQEIATQAKVAASGTSPSRRTWTGIAFEQVCLLHVPQIKQALGIAGVQTDMCSWHFAGDEDTPGAQIDMLIARRDKVINLCEMKYSTYDYEITPKYSRELRERCATFKSVTKTRHSLHTTLITPCGLKQNANTAVISQTIVLDNLFDYKS